MSCRGRIVFFLEEPSAKAFLDSYLPRLFPGWQEGVAYLTIVFRGKQDLDRQLPKRLRAWQGPEDRFIVLRDQDQDDCIRLKDRLVKLCEMALDSTHGPPVVVRLACRELEAWYWGDPQAVESALSVSGVVQAAGRARYREIDKVVHPAAALKEVTNGIYQKILGSRAIGEYLTLDATTSRSPSFRFFVNTLHSLAST